MNAVERALEKQRLQLAIAAQRAALADHAAGIAPLFNAADRVRSGIHWLGDHPEIVAGGVAVLAAAKPGVRRFLWRWGKRGEILWELWRETSSSPRRAVPARG